MLILDNQQLQPAKIERQNVLIDALRDFRGISPFDFEKDAEHFKRLSATHGTPGGYGNSLGYIMQISRGEPLKYLDDKGNMFIIVIDKYGHDVLAVTPVGPTVDDVLSELGWHLHSKNFGLGVNKVYENELQRFVSKGFSKVDLSNPNIETPDDVFPEIIVNPQTFSLESPDRDKLREVTLRDILPPDSDSEVIGANVFLRPFSKIGGGQLKSKEMYVSVVHGNGSIPIDADFMEDGNLCVVKTSQVKQLRQGIHNLVNTWAKNKLNRSGKEHSDADRQDMISSYMVLIDNLDKLPDATLILLRSRDGHRLHGCAILDGTSFNSKSVLMNITRPGVQELWYRFLVNIISSVKYMDPFVDGLNFGGSEDDKLNSAKVTIGPEKQLQALFLKYQPPVPDLPRLDS